MAKKPSKAFGKLNACGRRIRKIRTEVSHFSQSALVKCLAKRGVNLDRTSLSRIESQERGLTDKELIAIAACLKTSVAYLTGETKEILSPPQPCPTGKSDPTEVALAYY